jgi:hypothetical protein
MANIFGTRFESPQEVQRRLISEMQASSKSARKNWASSLGYDLGSALARAIHGDQGKVEKDEAQFREEAVQAGQLVQDQLQKQGMSPHEAQLKARAHTIAVLRDRGDTELANQIQESTGQYLKEHQKEQADMARIKAATSASEEQTKESKQRQFLSQTEGQLTAELNGINERLGAFPSGQRGGPAYQELLRRQMTVVERIQTVREKEEEKNRYSITDIHVKGESGEDLIQRVAVNQNDPTDMIELGDPQLELPKMSGAAEKELIKMQNSYRNAAGDLNKLDSMIDGLGALDDAGYVTQATERAKTYFGTQDMESLLRLQLRSMQVSDAIKNLPPGVASDKDIELVMSGTLPPDASPAVIRAHLEAMHRVKTAAAEYYRFAGRYISDNGSSRGMMDAYDQELEVQREQAQAVQAATQQAEDDATNALVSQQAERQQIVAQIEQIQTAMSQPGFPEQAKQAYTQQLSELAQRLQQLNQAVDQSTQQPKASSGGATVISVTPVGGA